MISMSIYLYIVRLKRNKHNFYLSVLVLDGIYHLHEHDIDGDFQELVVALNLNKTLTPIIILQNHIKRGLKKTVFIHWNWF